MVEGPHDLLFSPPTGLQTGDAQDHLSHMQGQLSIKNAIATACCVALLCLGTCDEANFHPIKLEEKLGHSWDPLQTNMIEYSNLKSAK